AVHNDMNIKSVEAFPLNLEVVAEASGISKTTNLSCVVVRIETENGLVGCGFTAITEEEIVAAAINDVAAHHIVGLSVLISERIWDKLYWFMTPRVQSGYGAHAIAAIDVAVCD